jgi:hypothetical protein
MRNIHHVPYYVISTRLASSMSAIKHTTNTLDNIITGDIQVCLCYQVMRTGRLASNAICRTPNVTTFCKESKQTHQIGFQFDVFPSVPYNIYVCIYVYIKRERERKV